MFVYWHQGASLSQTMSQAVIYVEGLIGRLHSLTLGVLWSGTLEEATANCLQKSWAEEKKRERHGERKSEWGNEQEKEWMGSGSKVVDWISVFGFQERVDSWDVPQRQTAVPSKAHKPNALPLLREELSSLLNCACYVVYQTKLVGNVLSSRGIIFFVCLFFPQRIITVCICLHWLEYYSFKTDPASTSHLHAFLISVTDAQQEGTSAFASFSWKSRSAVLFSFGII